MSSKANVEEILSTFTENKTQILEAEKRIKDLELNNMVPFGKAIMKLRKDNGLTRREVTEALGVTPYSLYLVECPKKSRTPVRLERQIRYYDGVTEYITARKEMLSRISFKRSDRGRTTKVAARKA